MEEEKRMAKEYQLKMEAEQRAREKRLADLYRVKEKKLNLAMYVSLYPLYNTHTHTNTHRYKPVSRSSSATRREHVESERRSNERMQEMQRRDSNVFDV